jgi:hypothetical protein
VGAIRAERDATLTAGDDQGAWPPHRKFLLERHPRATWPTAGSSSAAFWLEVHEHLRRDAAGLELAADDYAHGRSSAAQLAVIAAPRLRGLVARMHGHHQIEDTLYFPAFRRTEPRLEAGFDRLEREHATLNLGVAAALAALAELRAAAEHGAEPETLRLGATRYVDAAAALCSGLLRHLTDEENLVVPLMIERRDAGMDARGRATPGAVADY